MSLRYAGTCDTCAVNLPGRTRAAYVAASRTVRCLDCLGQAAVAAAVRASPAAGSPKTPGHGPVQAAGMAPVDPGTAGSSARREYERRAAGREARIREAHPRLGGLILALSEEPQSTTAWARGARGEELLGARLDTLAAQQVRVLHDRRIPRTRANIDHVAVGPTGVHVIDAKRYTGRPSREVEGGLFRPRVEKLVVGRRDCTRLVDGVLRQVDLVVSALRDRGLTEVPVTGTLCFIEADWPLVGGSFVIRDVAVVWPKKLAERLTAPGSLGETEVVAVHEALAKEFPPA
ncbi:NERD domain-containing protein [Cellulomonas sp. zg-ZUI222]|uniref:NERD domain-containing protein n=3 Tax=Cellulomonadaceae TaxID=85016 RepID=A0ABX8D9H7_9CELL|nr:NERD domain-containing protein [Cellulomonas sp. zg-ZUI22]MBO0922539.1 NERD domain-containing protein [Cellulomonas wangleii]MBO0926756.1 NERD domain-containing protein [Cellulomonas wangleii]QVI64080.1 NERD domain-containing protein [Cellulomonas wangleii]